MKYLILPLFIVIGMEGFAQAALSGYVFDEKNGEALIGVSVFTAGKKAGTTTNVYGFFSISAAAADSLYFQYLGYELKGIKAGDEKTIRIFLRESGSALKEVVIASQRNVSRHGTTTLDMKQLSSLPAMGGERDLVKALQLMPGVKKGADGGTGMLVRGGAFDQNLVLLDDAPVYNPSHLLGFFSLFNTDAVKEATIQTGGFTADHGGRLSSVLDVRTLDGNTEKVVYSGSVGLLATRASVQAPLFRSKGSFMLAGRISYVNKLFELVGKKLPFYFYDLNAKVNYKLTKRDQLFLSIYDGDDVLKESQTDDSSSVKINSRMGNTISSLRWNHAFANQKQFSNLTFFTSRYRYHINADLNENNLFISSDITDAGLRYGIQHQVNTGLSLRYGAEAISHAFSPGATKLKGSFNENLKEESSPGRMMKEGAVYFSAAYDPFPKVSLTAGLRYSGAQSGNALYTHPEPRLQADYHVTRDQTFSVSYAKMVQYMFLLSGSSVVLPTDLWHGVSERIKPQQAHIISAGYQVKYGPVISKAEVYYKPMQALVEYKEGTADLVNGDLDDKIVQGSGRAYGLELSSRFTKDRISVTVNYTLSWSDRTFAQLNHGQTYLARFDRRHDLSLITGYELGKRVAFSAVWCYASGSRFTATTGHFMMPRGSYTDIDLLPIYSKRNGIVLSASHRLDMVTVAACEKSKVGKLFLVGKSMVPAQ